MFLEFPNRIVAQVLLRTMKVNIENVCYWFEQNLFFLYFLRVAFHHRNTLLLRHRLVLHFVQLLNRLRSLSSSIELNFNLIFLNFDKTIIRRNQSSLFKFETSKNWKSHKIKLVSYNPFSYNIKTCYRIYSKINIVIFNLI